MKATVEFEVNGCHDCVLCFTDTYEPIMYCTHPQKADNMPDTEKYVYKRTFPEWCPLIKSEEKQKNDV